MDDAGPSLRTIATKPLSLPDSTSPANEALTEYLDTESVANLDELFSAAGHETQIVNVLAELHPLLRAVAGQPDAGIHRGLVLPLPADPLRRPRVAAFWMSQIVGYLANRDVEVVAILAATPTPRLILSLDGTRGTELLAIVRPEWARDTYIDLTTAPAPSPLRMPRHTPRSPYVPLARLRDAFLSDQRETL